MTDKKTRTITFPILYKYLENKSIKPQKIINFIGNQIESSYINNLALLYANLEDHLKYVHEKQQSGSHSHSESWFLNTFNESHINSINSNYKTISSYSDKYIQLSIPIKYEYDNSYTWSSYLYVNLFIDVTTNDIYTNITSEYKNLFMENGDTYTIKSIASDLDSDDKIEEILKNETNKFSIINFNSDMIWSDLFDREQMYHKQLAATCYMLYFSQIFYEKNRQDIRKKYENEEIRKLKKHITKNLREKELSEENSYERPEHGIYIDENNKKSYDYYHYTGELALQHVKNLYYDDYNNDEYNNGEIDKYNKYRDLVNRTYKDEISDIKQYISTLNDYEYKELSSYISKDLYSRSHNINITTITISNILFDIGRVKSNSELEHLQQKLLQANNPFYNMFEFVSFIKYLQESQSSKQESPTLDEYKQYNMTSSIIELLKKYNKYLSQNIFNYLLDDNILFSNHISSKQQTIQPTQLRSIIKTYQEDFSTLSQDEMSNKYGLRYDFLEDCNSQFDTLLGYINELEHYKLTTSKYITYDMVPDNISKSLPITVSLSLLSITNNTQ